MSERLVVMGDLNARERRVAEALIEKGYELCRGGWPDFLACHPKTGRIVAVEVKSESGAISLCQQTIHRWLRRAGMHVLVTRPRMRSYTRIGYRLSAKEKEILLKACEIERWWFGRNTSWADRMASLGGVDGARRIIRRDERKRAEKAEAVA